MVLYMQWEVLFSKGKKEHSSQENTTNIHIYIKIDVILKKKYFPFTTYIPHTTQHAQASMAGAWVVGRGSAAGGAGVDSARGLTWARA
jgi:hypothetical protein